MLVRSGVVGVKVSLVVAAVLAIASLGATVPAKGSPALRSFSYQGAGTNHVNLATGDLRELWTGRAKPFGKVKTHVAGYLQLAPPLFRSIHTTMVIAVPGGDVLIGACTGTGVLPLPDGREDWACDALGGTGRFDASTGSWKLHIDIHRLSLQGGVQENAFTEQGSGQISWKT